MAPRSTRKRRVMHSKFSMLHLCKPVRHLKACQSIAGPGVLRDSHKECRIARMAEEPVLGRSRHDRRTICGLFGSRNAHSGLANLIDSQIKHTDRRCTSSGIENVTVQQMPSGSNAILLVPQRSAFTTRSIRWYQSLVQAGVLS